jgi:hypothetical protein
MIFDGTQKRVMEGEQGAELALLVVFAEGDRQVAILLASNINVRLLPSVNAVNAQNKDQLRLFI